MVVRLLHPGNMPDDVYQEIALNLIQMVRKRRNVHRGREIARQIVKGVMDGEWQLVRYFYKRGFQVVVAHRVECGQELPLSLRERQVTFLVSQGCANVSIATSLHIGEATVATHLRRAMAKMGGITRLQLIRFLPTELLDEEDIASLQIMPLRKRRTQSTEMLSNSN